MTGDGQGVVWEKYGAKLNSFMEEKVCVLSGDISCDWLGLKTSILEELFEKLDFIINLAATTDFDERYASCMCTYQFPHHLDTMARVHQFHCRPMRIKNYYFNFVF